MCPGGYEEVWTPGLVTTGAWSRIPHYLGCDGTHRHQPPDKRRILEAGHQCIRVTEARIKYEYRYRVKITLSCCL